MHCNKGMKIVKFFSWEDQFSREINKLRDSETQASYRQLVIFAFFIATLILMPILAVVVSASNF